MTGPGGTGQAAAAPRSALRCIEASAGTGKTHRLTSLAVTEIVEHDLRIGELLVVTFTLAAAAELRARIRQRLVQVRDHPPGEPVAPGDELGAPRVAGGTTDDERRARAARALTEFDTATIKTIHAFAASALGDAGAGVAPTDERRREAVADVLAAAAFDPASALWEATHADAAWLDQLLRLRLEHPDVILAPEDGADAPAPVVALRRTAQRANSTFAERQLRDGTRTFTDLLTGLDLALRDDDSPLLRGLRARYKVALIDEFQDTDALQWRIFERLFLEVEGHALVVVGDPKQAIYGFRGADVHTYLRAIEPARAAGEIERLDVNHRSDGALLAALNALFAGATFDEDRHITYEAVSPAPGAEGRRLALGDGTLVAPLAVRVARTLSNRDQMRAMIAEECAAEAERLLGTAVVRGDAVVATIREDDVVVLCATRSEFPGLKAAFARRGIRTTEAKSDDVLSSTAALHLEVALRALADPDDSRAVAALARSAFGAASESDDGVATTRARLAAWRDALAARGVAALGRAMCAGEVLDDALRDGDGERLLTDVQHLFELLDTQAEPGGGPAALLESLAELRTNRSEAGEEGVRTRRIDTDAPAVRLMTAHGAKGLEFGVVLCPFLAQVSTNRGRPLVWRDGSASGRMLDVAGADEWTDARLTAPTLEDRRRLAASADAGESRRLHYVALTRAAHRCVVWWMPAYKAQRHLDELAGLLFDRDEGGRPIQAPRAARAAAPEHYELDDEGAILSLASTFAAQIRGGLIEVAQVGRTSPPALAARGARSPATVPAEPQVAAFPRALATRTQRSSFSSLVSGRHGPDGFATGDDDAGALDESADQSGQTAVPDPFDGLAGAAFGTAVHAALEAALRRGPGDSFDDTAAAALDRALHERGLPVGPVVLEGLRRATAAPLPGGVALRELDLADVATELRFRLPVAPGVSVADLGALIARHDPAGPFASWARSLVGPELGAALVGSIDLVSTLGTSSTYSVLDYKTNLRDARGGGYGTDGLLEAMREADYPLQAALYLVALHRYLRWRLVGYDPARHLGSAHYLFLRGMADGAGIMTWELPAACVVELSDLLAGDR